MLPPVTHGGVHQEGENKEPSKGTQYQREAKASPAMTAQKHYCYKKDQGGERVGERVDGMQKKIVDMFVCIKRNVTRLLESLKKM